MRKPWKLSRRRGRVARVAASAAVALLLFLDIGVAVAADEHEEEVKRDLFAVITLEGLPCDEVVAVQKLADRDYIASCRSGDTYRVRITAGRVSVERR